MLEGSLKNHTIFCRRHLNAMKKKRDKVDDNAVRSQQLEVKSFADDAWYNAHIEVLEDRVRVQFDGFDEREDEIWDLDYLKKHAENINSVIRFSSPQLQDQDCTQVVEDMVVCARHVKDNDCSEEDEEVKYFDAIIIKVDRNPHMFGKEECCNCFFEAYWITGPDRKKHSKWDDNIVLSCGDICLLYHGNVETHPIVRKIMRLLGNRIHVRPVAQYVQELSDSGKSKSLTSGIKKKGEQRQCSSLSSEQTEEFDSSGIVTCSMESWEASSLKNRKGHDRDLSQQAHDCDTASRTVKVDAYEDSESMETVASEDVSSSTSSTVAKKRSKVNQPTETPVIPCNVGEKNGNSSPPITKNSSKVPLQRMRGSVKNVVSPPAWFTPTGDH